MLMEMETESREIVGQEEEAERSGLVFIEFSGGGTIQFALDKGVTSQDVLGILATSETPYMEFKKIGREIGDIDYAVFQQSENCIFSINADMSRSTATATLCRINGEKGGIADAYRTDGNTSFTEYDLAAYRAEVIKNRNSEQTQESVNYANKNVGGNGRNDDVTDYDELFRQDIASVCDGENPQLYTEQILAMMTGCTADGYEIPGRSQGNFTYEQSFDYIVKTCQDNKDAYDKVAQNVEFSTIYGNTALASVSQDDKDRFNLADYQYTGRLTEGSAGLEAGQTIAFTAAEVLAIGVWKEDGGSIHVNTALVNESFEKMSEVFREPDKEARTFRCYAEREKRAYDVTFFLQDGEKRFYIEDEYPLMMGEGTVSDDFEFTAYNAKDFLGECGRDFSGKKDVVIFDIHEPERTQALIGRAEDMETLPVQLNVEMSFDGEKQPAKYFYFNDEQEAKRFSRIYQKEMQEFSDTAGVEVGFESFIRGRDDARRKLQKVADSYTESPAVKAFREKTDGLFHELDGNNAESIENIVKSHVQGILDDYGVDAVVVAAVLAGSRSRGIEREDSDVDVVVEYYGNIAEDELFNMINKDYLVVAGNKIDINPITEGKTGTLDTYLPEMERYLAEKAREMEREQKAAADNSYANFRLQKHADDKKYDLIADVKGADGKVRTDVAIAEFPDKVAALAFSEKNGIQSKDITNCLQNRISQKKHLMDKKGADRTEHEEHRQKNGTELSNWP